MTYLSVLGRVAMMHASAGLVDVRTPGEKVRRMSVKEPVVDRSRARTRKLLAGVSAFAIGAIALLWRLIVEPSGRADTLTAFDAKAAALYMWIAIGSGLGGIARFWFSGVAARLTGGTFPWGTIAINVLGSFVIGLFAMLTGPDGRLFVSSTTRQFVMVGICGGFTTFSSFSLQTLNLLNDGEWAQALGNIGGSVVLCSTAVWAGHAVAASFNVMK